MPETEDKLTTALLGGDELGAVVRAHIHIEFRLMGFVEPFLESPECLEKMRLEFEQMVILAQACGLHPQLVAPLKILNTIRNRFAHKLESSLGEQQVKSLYESFSPGNKELIQATYCKH